jgi:phospholipase C
MKHSSFFALVLGTLATVACADTAGDAGETAPSNFDAESPNDETKSTHLWVVNRGIDILMKHTDLPNAANTLAWMQDAQCRTHWQDGLLQADFLAVFNGATDDLPVPTGNEAAPDNVEELNADIAVAKSGASWMSHFYDPATGKNYLGFAKSSELPDDSVEHPIYKLIKAQVEVNGPVPVEAKGAALYRAGRAHDLLAGTEVKSDHPNEPKDTRGRGCYELGVALHYFTDIAQPMHAANFAATDLPRLLHSHWESYAEGIQAKFARADWSVGPKGTLDEVIQSTAVASKAHWKNTDGSRGPFFKAIIDAYRVGGTFDDNGQPHFGDKACDAAKNALVLEDLVTLPEFLSLDLPQCWQKNPTVVKETGKVLGDAQEMTARFLATLSLPPHSN